MFIFCAYVPFALWRIRDITAIEVTAKGNWTLGWLSGWLSLLALYLLCLIVTSIIKRVKNKRMKVVAELDKMTK